MRRLVSLASFGLLLFAAGCEEPQPLTSTPRSGRTPQQFRDAACEGRELLSGSWDGHSQLTGLDDALNNGNWVDLLEAFDAAHGGLGYIPGLHYGQGLDTESIMNALGAGYELQWPDDPNATVLETLRPGDIVINVASARHPKDVLTTRTLEILVVLGATENGYIFQTALTHYYNDGDTYDDGSLWAFNLYDDEMTETILEGHPWLEARPNITFYTEFDYARQSHVLRSRSAWYFERLGICEGCRQHRMCSVAWQQCYQSYIDDNGLGNDIDARAWASGENCRALEPTELETPDEPDWDSGLDGGEGGHQNSGGGGGGHNPTPTPTPNDADEGGSLGGGMSLVFSCGITQYGEGAGATSSSDCQFMGIAMEGSGIPCRETEHNVCVFIAV